MKFIKTIALFSIITLFSNADLLAENQKLIFPENDRVVELEGIRKYSIQLFASKKSDEAINKLSEIQTQLPENESLKLVQNGKWFTIREGSYDDFISAFISQQDLREAGFSDCYIVWRSSKTNPRFHLETGATNNRSGQAQLLQKPTRFQVDNSRNSPYGRLVSKINRGDNPVGNLLQGEQRLQDLDIDLHVQGKDLNQIKNSYLALYEDPECDPIIRRTALKSAADVAHYYHAGSKGRLEGFGLYKKLLKESVENSDDSMAQSASIELLGTKLELARSGLGDFYDVRRMSEAICEKWDNSTRVYHTSRLMACETYFFEAEYDVAVQMFETALADESLAAFPREKSMYLFFYGLSLQNSHEYQKALEAFQEILSMEFDESEKWTFKGEVWDMHYRALYFADVCAGQVGDLELRDQYRQLYMEKIKKNGQSVDPEQDFVISKEL